MADLIKTIFEEGYRGALICFLLVVSFKLYKMRLSNEIESNCCDGFKWKLTTANPGGKEELGGVV